jgi:hypothetical protein
MTKSFAEQVRTAFARTRGRCCRCSFPIGMLEAKHAVARAKFLATGSDQSKDALDAIVEQLRVLDIRVERPFWVPVKESGVGPLTIVCTSCHDKQVANEAVAA